MKSQDVREQMKPAAEEFRLNPHKAVTLMGMSGLGKTTIAEMLGRAGVRDDARDDGRKDVRKGRWFHYSADYRIGTTSLNEEIVENLKREVRHIPLIRALLESGTITFQNNTSIDNLQPLSTFVGKLGNPEAGGLSLPEFRRRQQLYYNAEIAAMAEVPAFIEKARDEGYDHFVNDTTGSLCELEREDIYALLARHTVLVYIKASARDEEELIARAQAYPKPLYFPPAFLDEMLARFMGERGLDYIALIEPDDFAGWVFPMLFRARLPKYERIAATYGYTITADEARQIGSEADFIDCIAAAIARGGDRAEKGRACL